MKEQSGEGEKRGDEQCPLSLSLSLCGAALSRLLRFYLSFYPDERCFFVEKKRLKGPRRREAEGAFFVCEEEGERREKLKKKNQVFLIFFRLFTLFFSNSEEATLKSKSPGVAPFGSTVGFFSTLSVPSRSPLPFSSSRR